ncbi:hypothetical protein GGU10DRAFT_317611, partial [Lentinula aff. detonsa]
MRNSIERLKETDGVDDTNELLSEIQRIMSLEARTKDVFRELDGFLILVGLLSTVLDVCERERRRKREGTGTGTGTGTRRRERERERESTGTGDRFSIPLIIEPPSSSSSPLPSSSPKSSSSETSPYPPPLLTTSLIFQITSLALTHHAPNMHYFHTHVGYDALRSALEELVRDEEMRVGTLVLLFSFAVGGWE